MSGLSGCTTAGYPTNGTTPPPAGYAFLTGNWVFQTTPSNGGTPFTGLAGFINEEGQNPGVNDVATAALMAMPGGCYQGADTIPLQGTVQASTLGLRSFDVNGQYVTINATKNAKADQVTGTYSVSGGCANGDAGTISGTRYAVLNGTYAGSTATGQGLQVALAQNVQGTGSGTFFVGGTGTFTGFSCFTTGTMAASNGSVIGNAVMLTFATNDAGGGQLVLTGTIDQAAATLTLTSVDVSGGSCPANSGGATLTRQ